MTLPSRNIFRYKMETRQSMHSLSPFMSDDAVPGVNHSPVNAPRKVPRSPYKVTAFISGMLVAARRNKALVAELSKPAPGSKELHFPTQYAQPFFIQCMACLWKQHWSYWRNPPYTAVRFLFTTFVALMFGTMFWDHGSKMGRKQDLFNAIGSMYNVILFLGTQNANSVQPVVAIERMVFYRERVAGMYSAIPYAIAQVVIELPYILAKL